MMKVRTRFAPSPTGYMHVGGVRTALFAWLVARQNNGEFILRIEDTDKAREVRGAEQHIQDSLNALGLDWDEGPFRQSERLASYKKWVQKLIQAGRAYPDPYSVEELNKFREEARRNKKPFRYKDHRPGDRGKVWNGKDPLRFKSGEGPMGANYRGKSATKDLVMGTLETGPEAVDDFILIKSDGFPTYNFAHIVDDIEMKITHVIRGQEFLPSLPNYRDLYEALGEEPPFFATVPHILNEEGNKKLSKRDGAKDVLEYIKDGYLPEALINFIASLGWNDGTEQEIFSMDELIKSFDLSRVQRSGARFDKKRLDWMNAQYIAKLTNKELIDRVETAGFWAEDNEASADDKKKLAELAKLRMRTLADVNRLTIWFFEEPEADKVSQLLREAKIDKTVSRKMLEATKGELAASSFSESDIKERLNSLLQKLDTKPSILFSAIRIVVTGQPYSPELFGTLEVLGREKTLARIDTAISALV